jgi:hypothetical protein
MPSEYVKDLVDHKTRVAKHMQKVANGLVERMIVKGDILPYSIDGADDEPATLMTLIDVAWKLKRDASSGAQFQWSEQVNRLVQNTLAYLVSSPENTRSCYWIASCVNDVFLRAAVHDNSKFGPDEYEAYEKAFPDLQKYAYGSDEFKAALATIRPAIEHHYRVNDHHPEFFEEGINGMHVVQMIEMLCDWKAASERSKTDFIVGLEMNRKRFNIDDQLFKIIRNTVWYQRDILD